MPKITSVRRFRTGVALPMLLLLTAARTTVAPLPETLIGVSTDTAIGETFTVHKGDVVLRAKIFETEVVTIDAPISVSIAKFKDELVSGAALEPVLAPKKTEQLTGADGRLYCGENQRTRSKFGELWVGDWFSKYEPQVRFCFVDSDGDNKLDKVFLAGAKDPADQGARTIEPTPYSLKTLQPDLEGGVIELRVEKFKPETNQVLFRLHLSRNGQDIPFSYIMTIEDGRLRQTYPDLRTNPAKAPYPAYFNNVLGAGLGIMSVNANKAEAEVKVTRPFPQQLFKPITIQYQTIYIYY